MRYVAAEANIDSSVTHKFQLNCDVKYKYVYKYDI